MNNTNSNTNENNNIQQIMTNGEFEFHSIDPKPKRRKITKTRVIKYGMFDLNGKLLKIYNTTSEPQQDGIYIQDIYHSMLGNKIKSIVKKKYVFRDLKLITQQLQVGDTYNVNELPLRISQKISSKPTKNVNELPLRISQKISSKPTKIKSKKVKMEKIDITISNLEIKDFKPIPLFSRIKMMMGIEIWRKVPLNHVEKYAISSHGRIRNTNSNRLLSIHDHSDGYKKINLRTTTEQQLTTFIHRLVAMAFIPNPNDYKEVNHKDTHKYNNNYKNLEWVSRQQNLKHYREQNIKNINLI